MMADIASYKTTGTYSFSHGRRWQIPSFDTTTSLQPWYCGTASAHLGDVRINVLYRDGHVELKIPDVHSYINAKTTYYFR